MSEILSNLPRHTFQPHRWRRATACGPTGDNCVEANLEHGRPVGVRDSKSPGDTVLIFAGAGWSSFLRATRTGDFDH